VLVRSDTRGLSADALTRAINDERGNSELKGLVPGAVSAQAMMYRAPTPFERTLHEKNPELPMARMFRYVVLEYRDNAARDAALE
jgi:hypothetical protein